MQLSSSRTTTPAETRGRTAEDLADPAGAGGPAGLAQAGNSHLTLASVPAWRHRLVLTGKLDHRTAVELEDEIECLCEEGVAMLTVDLRRLDAIDPAGAKAIALQGTACKRRGRGFAVVPGSLAIHRALAEAGAESLLTDDPGATGVLRLSSSAPEDSPPSTSTVMVKDL
jgi:anti-anti-sigma regulatory factor